jgi:hypothetical protein
VATVPKTKKRKDTEYTLWNRIEEKKKKKNIFEMNIKKYIRIIKTAYVCGRLSHSPSIGGFIRHIKPTFPFTSHWSPCFFYTPGAVGSVFFCHTHTPDATSPADAYCTSYSICLACPCHPSDATSPADAYCTSYSICLACFKTRNKSGSRPKVKCT